MTHNAAAASQLRSRSKLLSLSLGSLGGTGRSLLCARAQLIALSGLTRTAAAASATLSINAAALALGSLSGINRAQLGTHAADRPVGCDTRRRRSVGYGFDRGCNRSLKLERHRPLGTRCSARAPLIDQSGVALAAAAASATHWIEAALALGSLSGISRSLLVTQAADRPVGCDARRRSGVGYALDQCFSCSRKLEQHEPLAARNARR